MLASVALWTHAPIATEQIPTDTLSKKALRSWFWTTIERRPQLDERRAAFHLEIRSPFLAFFAKPDDL